METRTIIDQLTTSNGLPRAALAAAAERRKEMAPLFVATIENYLSEEDIERPAEEALFLMFHLLGDWRETSAYPALARLLRLPEEDLDDILGDGVTETSHRVMAAVFDGDPQPIYDIILDPDASEYIRARMCETLAMAVQLGKLERAEAARFLRDCFMHLQPQAECYVWEGWQAAIAMLGLKELTSIVEKAFRRRYIHPSWLQFADFQEDLEKALAAPNYVPWEGNGNFDLFGDTIEELSAWHGFAEERKREEARRAGKRAHWESDQAVNPHRNVGRNDPCPCGSGKKFKKRCLQ
jgi:hypothetical protein